MTATLLSPGSPAGPQPDARDLAILRERVAALNEHKGPRVGDYVRFADGVQRRISHLWDGDPQTSDAGRFYLDRHGCSFSGTLRPTVPASTLTATDETLDGMVWFFHHDIAQANGGVAATIPFRLYTCSLPAP